MITFPTKQVEIILCAIYFIDEGTRKKSDNWFLAAMLVRFQKEQYFVRKDD
jgi:hypothetical protein